MAPSREFGEISGYPIGSVFRNRSELHISGVHKPLEAGISGSSLDGADSIVLNGGYVDDIDEGNYVIYTGHGGRNNSGRQIKDQEITSSGNWGLKNSCDEGIPVRVVRGPKGDPRWSPASSTGYRYDGLYLVERYWSERGADGYRIWRYRLERIDTSISLANEAYGTVERRTVITDKPIRNARLAQKLKKDYDFSCQICSTRLTSPAGPYAESAHIKPLGRPDNGPDVKANMLCLCPNHHKLLDSGGIVINDEHQVIQLPNNLAIGTLTLKNHHRIESEFINWHRNRWAVA